MFEQQQDEGRILFVRRHWLLFVNRLVTLGALAVLVPTLLAVFVPAAWQAVLDQTAAGALLVMGTSLFILFLGLYILHAWVEYSLDVWIVSNKRIVNIEQRGLFSRDVSELFLDKVQDVTVEVHGVLPTMFRYGDVLIQTAGESPRFHFDDIPNPHAVAEKIMELHRVYTASLTPPEQKTSMNAESRDVADGVRDGS